MSKTWYPVINYEKCNGTCFDYCENGVYAKEGDKTIVAHPENCVEGCHGCQNACPAGAITYFGDNEAKAKKSGCCGDACDCGCVCEEDCDK